MKPTRGTVVGLLFLFLFLSLPSFALAADSGSELPEPGSITGQILKVGGAPFTQGFVALFSSENLDPMDYGQTRRSPKMIAFLDEQGKFTTQPMAPGSYFVGAMERKGWRGGPPKMGEKRYSAFDEQEKYLIVSLKSGQTLDIGSVVVKEPPTFPELTELFTIEGRLVDKDGKGIPDAVVVVKRDYTNPKGEFISAKTAFNGHYQIQLPPGNYYLIARETVAGSMRPKPDSMYGELGQREAIGIGGKTGNPATYIGGTPGQKFENVDITMFKIPIPDLKRKEVEALVKSEQFSKDDLAENLPLRKMKTDEGAVKSEIKAAGEETKK